LLTGEVKKGLDQIEAESPCARSLKGLDRDALLKRDVQRICDELSTLEAGRILRLSAKFIVSDVGDAEKYRKEMKSIVFEVMKRMEKKYGRLNLPRECQDLLKNLL
jgi:hypothetical protein